MNHIDIINEIANREKTFYLYSKRTIQVRSKVLLSIFKSSFTNFQNYYAVKALPNPNILKIILDEGMGLDCSSKTELLIAKQLNVESNKIIFTSNYTSYDDLKLALEMGVIINLDDYSLINDLKKVCDENNLSFPEFLYFRLNPGIGKTSSETKSNILGGPNAKFGIPENKILDSIKLAKSYGMKQYGIHCMTGSNILDENYFYQLTFTLKNIIITNNLKPIVLNLGGGLGIPYNPNDKPLNISNVVDKIKEGLGDYEIDIVMENGRYITGPAGFLFTKVQVIKEAYGKKYLGVNACMSNLMRPGMYGSYHNITNFTNQSGEEETYQIVGNLCENNDWFGKNRLLYKTKVGDILVMENCGAHSHSMGFQYNGKLRCAEYIMDQNGVTKIRRNETIDDYLSTVINLF